jgi:hypothetical protein
MIEPQEYQRRHVQGVLIVVNLLMPAAASDVSVLACRCELDRQLDV